MQFCSSKNLDLKLAYGTLDETIFAHMTTLNIHKMSGLRNISQNIFAHRVTFNNLEL
jgi:hypothetical protein